MTNHPFIEVFELTQDGKSRQEISDELGISLSQVDRTRACKEYKELKIETNQHRKELLNDFRLKKAEDSYALVVKAFNKLNELIDSENEKIALEASKYVITNQDAQIKAINEVDMTELGIMMEEYNDQ